MSISRSSHITQKRESGFLRVQGKGAEADSSHNLRMGRKADTKAVNHLRAWREHRRLSQDELGALVDTKGNVIHQLETGKTRLSDKWLYRLAPALGTTPGFLLDYHPDDVGGDYLQAVLGVPRENRSQVLAIVKTFRKTGTET